MTDANTDTTDMILRNDGGERCCVGIVGKNCLVDSSHSYEEMRNDHQMSGVARRELSQILDK